MKKTAKKPYKVLVLYSFRTHKTGYYDLLFSRLSAKAEGFDVSIHRGSLKDLIISVKKGKLQVIESMTGRDLKEFDAVYFELWYKAPEQALAAAIYAQRHGVPILSEELARLVPMTKVGELASLADNNLAYPDTVTSSARELSRLVKAEKLGLGFPMILKDAAAYGGKNNFLVKTAEEAQEILSTHKSLAFIAQSYLPNEHDFRVIVLGGKARLVLRRTRNSAESHLNNTSAGGEGQLIPLHEAPLQLLALAETAAACLQRQSYAGVDILERNDTGEYVVLEVNQTPQIEIGAEIDAKMDVMLTELTRLAAAKHSGGSV